MATVDKHVSNAPRQVDRPFLMPVEDVFSISGRGTVVTGRVERGIVKVGQTIDVVGFNSKPGLVVRGVEMFRKVLDEAVAGDNIGLLLESVAKEDVQRGQVVTAPGSIRAVTKFRAEVYILTGEEGGRRTPIFSGYRPQFYIRTTDVTGVVSLEGADSAQPGGIVTMNVELVSGIALENYTRFSIREGGRTIGAGVVTRVVP